MKKELSYSENTDLVVKILAGEASTEEADAFKKWLQSAPENQAYFEKIKRVWEETNQLSKNEIIDLEREWYTLKKSIWSEKDYPDHAFHEVTKRSIGFYVIRVAAVLLIMVVTLFGALYLGENVGYKEIITAMESKGILLPDGSEVTLNVQSSLKYPKRFNPKSRNVILQGEAFFNVQPDSLKPFHIETEELRIEVLGTSFNVDAYEEKEMTEVVVETGKVAVSKTGNEASRILLEAGEKAALSRSEKTLIKEENKDANFLAWKTRKLNFENLPLSQVVTVLNEVYHSNISIQNDSLSTCTLTATFDKQSLEAVLNVIKSTLDLSIIQSEDSIQINGTGC